MRCFVTGATGFVGSHVAEECVRRGHAVVALARPGSDVAMLERLGADLIRGDLNQPDALRQALRQTDVVIHCAAKVGDWGPVEEYRKVNVEGLRLLLEAVRTAGTPVYRFVHVSTLGVYEARDHYTTDESFPLPCKHIDGYTQSKVEAEQLALHYHRIWKIPVTIVRPGFIYGPRDRTVVPRLLEMLRREEIRFVGDSSKALNTIYVGNLVDAIFLTLERPEAVGQIYNLTDGELISKRRFLYTLADLAGLPRPTRTVPLWLVRLMTPLVENTCRLLGRKTAPRLTQARLKFIGLNLCFSIEKARRELGYSPRVSFDQGIREAIRWWQEQERDKSVAAATQKAAPEASALSPTMPS